MSKQKDHISCNLNPILLKKPVVWKFVDSAPWHTDTVGAKSANLCGTVIFSSLLITGWFYGAYYICSPHYNILFSIKKFRGGSNWALKI